MEDLQQHMRKKGSYTHWTTEESDKLLELMVDAATRGRRENNGCFSKQTVEETILPVLNKNLGCEKTHVHYLSRLKWFKNKLSFYSTLLKFSSSFGFDSTTKMFTASDEVWKDYIKAHPNNARLRYETFSDYEALEIAVGNSVAVGKNSIGLEDDTDAKTLGVEEGRDIHIDYGVDGDVFITPTSNVAESTIPPGFKKSMEPPKQAKCGTKRNRVEYERTSSTNGNTYQSRVMEQLNKLTTTFERVHSLLKKKVSLMEKRERERSFTTWDGIKEIPNLDEDLRFKAFDLLDTKTKKEGFLKMDPKERAHWINRKMQGN